MIISPDSYIYNEKGVYEWTPQKATFAWKSAEKALVESACSGKFTAVAFLSGPPGAGKTTYLEKNQKDGWLYFDATLCAPKRRKHLLKLVEKAEIKKVCIYLDTPIEVCLERNDKRTSDRKVPRATTDQMYKNLVSPVIGEGFDEVITVTHQGQTKSKKAIQPITKASVPLKGNYFALVLTKESQEELLKTIPPKHTNLFAHHVTVFFGPSNETVEKYRHLIGEIASIKCLSVFENEFGQCVSVEIPPRFNFKDAPSSGKGLTHHITISCSLGTKPVYSNELFKIVGGKSLPAPLNLIGKLELV